MKKVVLLSVALAVLGLTQSMAQNTSFGVKAEAGMSNFILDDMAGWKSRFGVGGSVGGFVKIDFSKYFAIQPEALLHLQNSEFEIDGIENDFRYFGMEVPVYAVAQLVTSENHRAFIGVGPYGRIGFSARNRTLDLNYYKKNGGSHSFMQLGDVGCAVLVGYEFEFDMQINASYKYGFLNQLNEASGSSFLRNQSISLGIGYRF
ncbi:MAG: porin family protein [Prevotellaceae bacterium]|nr:porin family protein [Prevotellaceae bacterium]